MRGISKEIEDILEYIETVRKHHESDSESNAQEWVDWSLQNVKKYRIGLLEGMLPSQNVD